MSKTFKTRKTHKTRKTRKICKTSKTCKRCKMGKYSGGKYYGGKYYGGKYSGDKDKDKYKDKEGFVDLLQKNVNSNASKAGKYIYDKGLIIRISMFKKFPLMFYNYAKNTFRSLFFHK